MTASAPLPLTTTFIPPSSCLHDVWATVIYDSYSNSSYTSLRLGPLSASECLPAGWKPASYFSPGVCPSGYAIAKGVAMVYSGITETRATCCPMRSTQTYSIRPIYRYRSEPCQWQPESGITTNIVFTQAFINGSVTTSTVSFDNNGAINAHGVEIRWQSTDFSTPATSSIYTSFDPSSVLSTIEVSTIFATSTAILSTFVVSSAPPSSVVAITASPTSTILPTTSTENDIATLISTVTAPKSTTTPTSTKSLPPSSTAPKTSTKTWTELSTAAQVGISVGAAVGAALITALAIYLLVICQRKRQISESTKRKNKLVLEDYSQTPWRQQRPSTKSKAVIYDKPELPGISVPNKSPGKAHRSLLSYIIELEDRRC